MKNYQKNKAERFGYDRRTYNILSTVDQDPYSEEGMSTHRSRRKETWSKKRKRIYTFEYRMYRTWKYNRKTKWK